MAQHGENKTIVDAVELLRTHGFDGLAEAVTVLLNSAMVAARTGYANGYKDKSIKTRLSTLALMVPQSRDGEFYPQSLERGLRSERALLLAIAEMYVQGVSTRRVKRVVEALCGTEMSSTRSPMFSSIGTMVALLIAVFIRVSASVVYRRLEPPCTVECSNSTTVKMLRTLLIYLTV